ncbi:MAG TPA: SUMF1/EgtB/PvdO family nonheme iron enzyme [Polyangiaceae bacterium]
MGITSGGNAGAGGKAGAGGSAGSEAGAGAGGVGGCEDEETRCSGNIVQECADGEWQDRRLCENFCRHGECENPPSCEGSLTCAGSVSCCRALEVPGGTFLRDYDGKTYEDSTHPATVSGFLLDRFEVTVSRMRNFVNAYPELDLEPGEGKAEHISEDEGWKESYALPASQDELIAALQCPDATFDTGITAGNQLRAVNCVTFPIAYAFCIWDGGRLPTEAEWNLAAAGGSEQREFPWQAPLEEEPPTPTYAYFDQFDGLPTAVGSTSPAGDGRWGHADLAGNVFEWTLDTFSASYPDECVNCLSTTTTGERALRGGSYLNYSDGMAVAARWPVQAAVATSFTGFRCVHDIQ